MLRQVPSASVVDRHLEPRARNLCLPSGSRSDLELQSLDVKRESLNDASQLSGQRYFLNTSNVGHFALFALFFRFILLIFTAKIRSLSGGL